MNARHSVWSKANLWIKNEYLVVQSYSNEQLCNNIFILMALSKDDPYIQHIVTEKVQAQFDLHAQATRIAALRSHIDTCSQNLILALRKQPNLLLFIPSPR